MRNRTAFVVVLLSAQALVAQAPQVPFSAIPSGYGLPAGFTVAPGQVVRLFVQGIGANLSQPVFATSLPLPTTLADISIRFQEVGSSGAGLAALLPLFAVVPLSACGNTVFGSLNS
jgi:hypothetical protein